MKRSFGLLRSATLFHAFRALYHISGHCIYISATTLLHLGHLFHMDIDLYTTLFYITISLFIPLFQHIPTLIYPNIPSSRVEVIHRDVPIYRLLTKMPGATSSPTKRNCLLRLIPCDSLSQLAPF